MFLVQLANLTNNPKVVGVASVVVCGAASLANEISLPPFIQYGALGLAGFLIYKQCGYLEKITEQHVIERKELVASLKADVEKRDEIVEKNTAAFDKVADALNKKPCLKDEDFKKE